MSFIQQSGTRPIVSTALAQSGAAAESLQAQMQAARERIAGLASDLQALVAELQAVMQQYRDAASSRPARGPDEKQEDFLRRLTAWEGQLAGLGEKIRRLQDRTLIAQAAIDRTQREVSSLQDRINAARSDERLRAEEAAEAARAAAEDARDASRVADRAESSDHAPSGKVDPRLTPGAPRGGGIPGDRE